MSEQDADSVARAVEATLERWEAHRRAADASEKAEAEAKEHLTNRVSFAAIALTLLMSFVGFTRSERDSASTDAKTEAARALGAVDANWALYQARSSERANYALADDTLAREAAGIPDGDPRIDEARVHHAAYLARMNELDRENRRVFFNIQDLRRHQILQLREAARLDRKVARYDMSMRVLTLAIVLLSVALLANRESLFWVSLAIGFVAAMIALGGYFALF